METLTLSTEDLDTLTAGTEYDSGDLADMLSECTSASRYSDLVNLLAIQAAYIRTLQ